MFDRQSRCRNEEGRTHPSRAGQELSHWDYRGPLQANPLPAGVKLGLQPGGRVNRLRGWERP